MSWRDIRQAKADHPAHLYQCSLRYAHTLWHTGTTARALLAIDRALFTPLNGCDPVLQHWPLPYRALQWLLTHHDGTTYLGNPRHHFQHLAGRVTGPDRERKRWVAWACWYITRQVRPEFAADTRHNIVEPSFDTIHHSLSLHGIDQEAATWQSVVANHPTVIPQTWIVACDQSLCAR